VADYLATMSANLAALAQAHRFDSLGYLLEMAAMEAEELAQRAGVPRRPPGSDDET
jgi:hypothetical protein